MSRSIEYNDEMIPIYPTGFIADQIIEDGSVCYICEVTDQNPQSALKSYDDWAETQGWSTLDRLNEGEEWSLLLEKKPIMINLSQKGPSTDSLLLITIIEENSGSKQ
jgi:hypothetical protein